ncbi:nicotinamide riboside transporter PnuC [Chitinimonas lacunae]|uniref:Nicotinamide riboside transporter PnuC n=1 Tax=Chitinimonas lacunae TaxID=1963018 RepID=A0ABV8MMK6_9NEIS
MIDLAQQIRALTVLELAGFYLTLTAIFLAARNRWQTWPLQFFGAGLYVYLFLTVNLFGEAALNGLYGVLAIYGWVRWHRGTGPELPISRMTRLDHAILWGVGIAGTVTVANLQVNFLPTDLPWLDSTVFVFGCLAQWLQARRRVGNWPLWIVLDLIAAGIYAYKSLYVTALLYVILTGLAAWGWFDWRRRLALHHA